MGRIEELLYLKTQLRSIYSKMDPSTAKIAEFGDYTYGTPVIKTWGEGANLRIGKFCSLAACTIVLGGNHRTDWATTYPFNVFLPSYAYIIGHPATNGDIHIGNDVWIGNDAKIMSGVTIADGAVVAANALVTRDINAYEIHGGVPAKLIKKRFNDDVINKLLIIKWWDWPESHLIEAIPLLQSADFSKLFAYHEQHVSGAL